MKRKGIDFAFAPHLGFRNVTELDLQLHCTDDSKTWSDSRRGHCVITSRKTGDVVPFSGWSRTNMVYGGKYRKQTRGVRNWERLSTLNAWDRKLWEDQDAADGDVVEWDEDRKDGYVPVWHDVYWTSTTYWVEDGCVYTATSRHFENPNS